MSGVSETEFIGIVEAAADFDDYSWGKYFMRNCERINRKARSIRNGRPMHLRSESRLIRTKTTGHSASVLINNLFIEDDIAMRLRKPFVWPHWAHELREMFDGLDRLKPTSRQSSPLNRLCQLGSTYGLQKLRATVTSRLWDYLSPQARKRITAELCQTLGDVTRPCFELELKAHGLAFEALLFQGRVPSTKSIEQRFLQEDLSARLLGMFKKFPVLARLWSRLICQWCDKTVEFLLRFEVDRPALSRTFFRGGALGKIINVRAGLSDPHNGGRTVMLLQVGSGSVVYKPRSGYGEWEWSNLINWMTAQSFEPSLKAARVLQRKRYCWMETISFASCKNQAGARRFYERLGALISAAYLLRAVDCHRDNMIAAGEHPVLVDAEALGHIGSKKLPESFSNLLYRTGFFQRLNRELKGQIDSSVLGGASPRQHNPHIGDKALSAIHYKSEIISGFCKAWRCIVGYKGAKGLTASWRRLRQYEVRRIYRPTAIYSAIRRASIQPAALRSGIARDILIGRLCHGSEVPSDVIDREIRALEGLDVPYFTYKRIEGTPKYETSPSSELVRALRRAIHR